MKNNFLEILEIKSIVKIFLKIIDELLSHLAAIKDIVIGLDLEPRIPAIMFQKQMKNLKEKLRYMKVN